MANLIYSTWRTNEEDGSIWPMWDETEEMRGLSLSGTKEERWLIDFPYLLGKWHITLILILHALNNLVIFLSHFHLFNRVMMCMFDVYFGVRFSNNFTQNNERWNANAPHNHQAILYNMKVIMPLIPRLSEAVELWFNIGKPWPWKLTNLFNLSWISWNLLRWLIIP
jgi:hypothetical protein